MEKAIITYRFWLLSLKHKYVLYMYVHIIYVNM